MFQLLFVSLTNFVCLQETEHSQQVCSDETGDIATKEKSKCTCIRLHSCLFTLLIQEHHHFAQ